MDGKQIGRNFDLEIVEGQADAKRSELVREGLWQTVAGKPLQFKLVCYDRFRFPSPCTAAASAPVLT